MTTIENEWAERVRTAAGGIAELTLPAAGFLTLLSP